MLTVEEIDEALTHARAVPVDKRGAAWQAYVDSLLEMRHMLTPSDMPTFSH